MWRERISLSSKEIYVDYACHRVMSDCLSQYGKSKCSIHVKQVSTGERPYKNLNQGRFNNAGIEENGNTKPIINIINMIHPQIIISDSATISPSYRQDCLTTKIGNELSRDLCSFSPPDKARPPI